jgi:hypothetical protein
MVLNEKNIEVLKQRIKDALMREWKAQGHFMNGKIVEDIEYELNQSFGSLELIGKMYAYGTYQETGVEASNIPFSPGSGAKRSKYIEGLMRFVEKRMAITDLRTKKSVAFAIAHTQKKEGMPTRGSFAFSSTGKRTGWINDAFEKNIGSIGDFVRQFYGEFVRTEMENVITRNIKAV